MPQQEKSAHLLDETKRQGERDRELAVEEERKKLAEVQEELDEAKTVSPWCNSCSSTRTLPYQSLAKKEEEEVQRIAELEELVQHKNELEHQLVRAISRHLHSCHL